MHMNDYQKAAMRTCNIPYSQKVDMLRHGIFCLASEAGEFAGIFQKEYQGHPVCLEHAKRELGDVMWAVAEICTALGFDMSDVAQTNIAKLKARFPDGFCAERSINRAKGDI